MVSGTRNFEALRRPWSAFSLRPIILPLAKNVQQSWSKHSKPPNEDHQWSKSSQDMKENFFLSPQVKIITGCRIFTWGWNCKINLWPRALLCVLQRISWFKLKAASPVPGAAVSSVFPLWSFLICQNTFLLNLCGHFNVYSILSPYAEFLALLGRPHR